jgi:long-chain acyl-CoA synthetase
MLAYDNVIAAAEIGCDFDRLDEGDEIIAYLPVAWVGDHIFSYAQAILAGLCVNCHREPTTRSWTTGARSAPRTPSRPPRVFENMLTLTMVRMEDASALKRRVFKFFIDHANPRRRAHPERRGGGLAWDRLVWRIGDVVSTGPCATASGCTASRSATRRARRSARRSSASTGAIGVT